MDIVHEPAAGLDISKRDAKVCLRVPGDRAGTYTSTATTWGSTAHAILKLREFLEHEHVTTVVMEATSDYWKPFYYLLEESLPVMLVNAKAARNIPGRKTDVSDSACARKSRPSSTRSPAGSNHTTRSRQGCTWIRSMPTTGPSRPLPHALRKR
ncbi:transposase [Arthrobacter sp. OAP107]